jgi:predicted transposase YdaD
MPLIPNKGCAKMSLGMLVREDPSHFTHHDQLFKQLIHNFFSEFLDLFFPTVYQHIDFSSLKPMSEEMFTDLFSGECRRADIVIEAKLKGQETLIIIHVEPQSYGQPDFNERMYHYFSLLYNKYRKPILPIAIFSYDENRYERNEYNITFPFFHVLSFQFLMVELRKMNWKQYIQSNNLIAAALISKMGYSRTERVQVKKEFLRMLVKMEINPAKMELINGFFETYLSLNESEEKTLMEEIKQLNSDEKEQILKLPNSWVEKGKKEGIQEGLRKIALNMLKEGLSIELIARVTNLDYEEIEKISKHNL